jgi:hypothetical protein
MVNFVCDLPADIVVEVAATDTMGLEEVRSRLSKSRLFITRTVYFYFEDWLGIGHYSLQTMRVGLQLERQLLEQNLASYYR